MPLSPSIRFDRLAQLYPFASHWADVPGGRMHYVDEGPTHGSPTLLFVHGNPTWSFHWRRLIDALAIDLPMRRARPHWLRSQRKAAAILPSGGAHRQPVRAHRSIGTRPCDAGRTGLGRRDRSWCHAPHAGATRKHRPIQHWRVSAALHPVADSGVPRAADWPPCCARRQPLQPRRTCV